jgi:SAM-dependent methyltransferase
MHAPSFSFGKQTYVSIVPAERRSPQAQAREREQRPLNQGPSRENNELLGRPVRPMVATMTDDLPPRLTRLTFHGPLSEARAARLVGRLTRTPPATVLDLGCGWGELMLRILAAVPGATGTGIDLSGDDLARGRDSAEARGLASRVSFLEESAVGTTRGPADLVLCVGSSHVLSEAKPPRHTIDALAALRRLVNPGGRVFLGECFWERPPAPAEIAAMWPGITAEDHYDLAGLVDLAIAAGFRPEWIETASLQEWDDFESGYMADVEEWLADHPDHPQAAETRKMTDDHLSIWLRGSRGIMGLAYLTLIPAG